MGLFDKFKLGLGKSSSDLSEGFKNVFSKKVIDDNVLTEFEELIISSDAGIDVARELRKDFENFKVDKKLIKLIKVYEDKVIPTMPIGANILMSEYNIPEGKTLGNKLKMLEEFWVENGFQISNRQIQKIIKV